MRTALKTVLTFVATLALLLGQAGLMRAASTSAPVAKAGCCGSACPTHCCLEKGSSTPTESLPAVPVASPGQQLQAGLLPVMLQCLNIDLPVRTIFVPPLSLSAVVAPVPFYVRTHSFLI